jgi:anti-sigma-K factor RskA
MSDPRTHGPEDGDPEVFAAEAALGLLGPDERRRAELRLARDPDLAAEVVRWEARFAALGETVPEVAPPAHVWSAIERQIAPPVVQRTPEAAGGLWSSLAFWRGLTSLSLAGAIAAVALVVAAPEPTPMPLVAALSPADGATFVIAVDQSAGMLRVMPVSLSSTDETVPELWIIPEGLAPISLGVVPAEGMPEHAVDPDMMPHFQTGATMAITMEPPGGSPTGAPTGPVVASGVLTNI